jgi:hypothetical protein
MLQFLFAKQIASFKTLSVSFSPRKESRPRQSSDSPPVPLCVLIRLGPQDGEYIQREIAVEMRRIAKIRDGKTEEIDQGDRGRDFRERERERESCFKVGNYHPHPPSL